MLLCAEFCVFLGVFCVYFLCAFASRCMCGFLVGVIWGVSFGPRNLFWFHDVEGSTYLGAMFNCMWGSHAV